ncbi:OLC1v1022709C2 [Oldenlandia corymbosa var. corymbosa]|uniref:OLC1v1022709C2 n=1 Tax=Oldenlandia corymbosa var. corymbosa TaxID=529605 RepID=A0AAV1BYF4_OLDCO|nr:OLC1v1022709C2 [Oldenlandia corymbosa var. corymbosa]
MPFLLISISLPYKYSLLSSPVSSLFPKLLYLHQLHSSPLQPKLLLILLSGVPNSTMNNWFRGLQNLSSRCRECVFSNCFFNQLIICFETGLLVSVLKRTAMSLLTCILALGGASVGTISGAIKGQTTETGLFRGAGVGAVTGAITGVQLLELMVNGEPFSKVALICSLVNGKIFMEWVSPAVLKAYQWQISNMDTSLREISDIFEVNGTRGLSHEAIRDLAKYKFRPNGMETSQETTCAICLMVILFLGLVQ